MDPNIAYTEEQAKAMVASGAVTNQQVVDWGNARLALMREEEAARERRAKIVEKQESRMMQGDAPAPAAPAAVAAAVKAEEKMEQAQALTVKKRPNALYLTGRERASFAGDKIALVQGYKDASLCNTLVRDALQRAYMAIEILDDSHANIIRARLAKAGVKNANSAKGGFTEISFKKATSIALQAEQWVYQAQAAAAKSMVKEANKCRHALVGKRKRTTAEKDALWRKRHNGEARPDRSDRAIIKAEKRVAALKQAKAERD